MAVRRTGVGMTTIDRLGNAHERTGRFSSSNRRQPSGTLREETALPVPDPADLALANDPETPAEVLTRLARSAICGFEWAGHSGEVCLSPAYKSVLFPRYRLIAANPSTPPEVLARLTRCADSETRLSAVRNQLTPSPALERAARYDLPDIAIAAEANLLLRGESVSS